MLQQKLDSIFRIRSVTTCLNCIPKTKYIFEDSVSYSYDTSDSYPNKEETIILSYSFLVVLYCYLCRNNTIEHFK